ncbi:MAG: 50S ribosomal protein L44e [Candidatus Diapherotrites archaeon]
MNLPKEIKVYCRKCRKHTVHKLKAFKTGKARSLAFGTRRFKKKHKQGYGGKAKFPLIVKKQNKKAAFMAECLVCKKKIPFVIPKRMKKVELT